MLLKTPKTRSTFFATMKLFQLSSRSLSFSLNLGFLNKCSKAFSEYYPKFGREIRSKLRLLRGSEGSKLLLYIQFLTVSPK